MRYSGYWVVKKSFRKVTRELDTSMHIITTENQQLFFFPYNNYFQKEEKNELDPLNCVGQSMSGLRSNLRWYGMTPSQTTCGSCLAIVSARRYYDPVELILEKNKIS